MFPRCCAGCGVEIEAGFLCRDCRQGLLQLKAFPTIDALDGGLFFFAYENRIKEAIHRIKFGREKDITVLLSEETEILLAEPEIQTAITKFFANAGMFRTCAENNSTDKTSWRAVDRNAVRVAEKDIWLWSGIPTDPGRLRHRGFDIPSVLFSRRAKEFGGRWAPLLCRTRKTLPMFGLSPEERRRNLQDCFAVTGNVRGKSVMLVDDIFTTGATFSAAATVLKEAGAVTVTGLAFCGSIENLR